jgi:hypothetical protein
MAGGAAVTDVEVILDWLNDWTSDIVKEISGLSAEELAWRPDSKANSVGVTVWHVSRWLDALNVQILKGQRAEEELWHTRGWLNRTGYDPRGIGYRGFGAITGYTQEEVALVPVLTSAEYRAYLEQVTEALRATVVQLGSDGLNKPTVGPDGTRTAYSWLKGVLRGCFGHLGEILAIKAMYARAHAPHSAALGV